MSLDCNKVRICDSGIPILVCARDARSVYRVAVRSDGKDALALK